MTDNAMRKRPHRLLAQVQQLLRSMTLLIRWVWNRWIRRDKAGTEAMRWVITLHNCDDLQPVLPEFREWLSRRPANSDAFEPLWELWQELSALKDSGRWHQEDPSNIRQGTPEQLSWRPALILTASAVMALGIGVYYFVIRPEGIRAHTAPQHRVATGVHSSGAGETSRLDLVDGSSILLRELSQVTLDFSPDRRHVQLDRGEARFEIAKYARAPFEVSVDEATLQAVGTKFSVKKTGPGGGRVDVYEGEVDLSIDQQQPVRVKAGQSAEFEKNLIRITDGPTVGTGSRPPSPPKVSLFFRGKALSDAAREFNRYNPQRQIIVDEEVSHRSVQGRFSATNPQGFAVTMSITWGMKCSISSDSRTGLQIIHLGMPGIRNPPPRPGDHVC